MKSLMMKSEPMLEEPMKEHYPMMHLNGKQMPEIEEWKLSEEYTLKVKVKMKDYHEHIHMDKKESSATLEVLAYEVA